MSDSFVKVPADLMSSKTKSIFNTNLFDKQRFAMNPHTSKNRTPEKFPTFFDSVGLVKT